MSDDIERLQRSLEQATAAEVDADKLDAETRDLRETWLAFGKLLEASVSPLRAPTEGWPGEGQGKVVGGQWPVVSDGQRKLQNGVSAIPDPSPAKRRRRWVLAAELVAACALLALLTGWLTQSPRQPKGDSSMLAARGGLSRFSRSENGTVPLADAPPWDDAIDAQLAKIDQRLLDVRRDQYADAGSATLLQYQVGQIGQDMQQDDR